MKIALALLATLASPVYAADCAQSEAYYSSLTENYDEARVGGGLHERAVEGGTVIVMVELWVSEETGTFTLLATNAQGVSCILTEGTNWHAIAGIEGEPS